MLIARAPVRINLAGGGTDLPAYYERFGGVLISTTIDKYLYVILNALEKDTVQISSSDYSTFYRYNNKEELYWGGDLRLPRAILSHFNIRRGLNMFLSSEIPPGTGLGSSSAVTVAIIKALSTALKQHIGKKELAELACYIEIEKLQEPIGKQDQYASAFGGLNWIEIDKEKVRVEPLQIPIEIRNQLERNLLLFFTGMSRKASEILSSQMESINNGDSRVLESLHNIKAMAYDVRHALEQGDLNSFGELLHENWVQKKRWAKSVSNPEIDQAYELARHAGALGGKITGAGGGGFLILYCKLPYQEAVTEILENKGLRRMDFQFENMGARVLMNAGLTISSANKLIT